MSVVLAKEFTKFRMPESSCPTCGYKMDSASSIAASDEETLNQAPQEGSYTICLACGEYLIFDVNLWVRKLTEEELQFVNETPDLKKILETSRDITTKMARIQN